MSRSPAVPPPGGDVVGRIERRAIVLTLVAVTAAWLMPQGGGAAAAGVAGGALLAFVSFLIIKRGVDSLTARAISRAPETPAEADRPAESAGSGRSTGSPGMTRGMGLFVLRYALLAGMAYVMIARLRLPPIGLLCGASVTMLAAAAEVMRRRPS